MFDKNPRVISSLLVEASLSATALSHHTQRIRIGRLAHDMSAVITWPRTFIDSDFEILHRRLRRSSSDETRSGLPPLSWEHSWRDVESACSRQVPVTRSTRSGRCAISQRADRWRRTIDRCAAATRRPAHGPDAFANRFSRQPCARPASTMIRLTRPANPSTCEWWTFWWWRRRRSWRLRWRTYWATDGALLAKVIIVVGARDLTRSGSGRSF